MSTHRPRAAVLVAVSLGIALAVLSLPAVAQCPEYPPDCYGPIIKPTTGLSAASAPMSLGPLLVTSALRTRNATYDALEKPTTIGSDVGVLVVTFDRDPDAQASSTEQQIQVTVTVVQRGVGWRGPTQYDQVYNASLEATTHIVIPFMTVPVPGDYRIDYHVKVIDDANTSEGDAWEPFTIEAPAVTDQGVDGQTDRPMDDVRPDEPSFSVGTAVVGAVVGLALGIVIGRRL